MKGALRLRLPNRTGRFRGQLKLGMVISASLNDLC